MTVDRNQLLDDAVKALAALKRLMPAGRRDDEAQELYELIDSVFERAGSVHLEKQLPREPTRYYTADGVRWGDWFEISTSFNAFMDTAHEGEDKPGFSHRFLANAMPEGFYALAMQELHDLKDWDRHNYLGEPNCSKLNTACAYINKALGETCYLVGSATHTKAYRDVDVRIMMADNKYDLLFGTAAENAFHRLVCIGISEWLGRVSNLPIDFQIQRRDKANKLYAELKGDPVKHRRQALGITSNPAHNPELFPAWRNHEDGY